MKNSPPAIGPRINASRKKAQLSLDALAQRSGVSKSMLSQIERGEANPTFATLWNLTKALGLEISELIESQPAKSRSAIDLIPEHLIPELRTPDGKCVLRILSPVSNAGQMEWYEIRLEPGGTLASKAHAKGAVEHLTVLDGELHVSSGGESKQVLRQATARYAADVSHSIRNEGKKHASALLVVINQN